MLRVMAWSRLRTTTALRLDLRDRNEVRLRSSKRKKPIDQEIDGLFQADDLIRSRQNQVP